MTGTVVWFTGPPSSGKTTLAGRVALDLDYEVPVASDVLAHGGEDDEAVGRILEPLLGRRDPGGS